MLKRQAKDTPDLEHEKSDSPLVRSTISGIAYGSYARVLLSPILDQLEKIEMDKASVIPTVRLEENPELLWQAVALADSLVSQIKSLQEC